MTKGRMSIGSRPAQSSDGLLNGAPYSDDGSSFPLALQGGSASEHLRSGKVVGLCRLPWVCWLLLQHLVADWYGSREMATRVRLESVSCCSCLGIAAWQNRGQVSC